MLYTRAPLSLSATARRVTRCKSVDPGKTPDAPPEQPQSSPLAKAWDNAAESEVRLMDNACNTNVSCLDTFFLCTHSYTHTHTHTHTHIHTHTHKTHTHTNTHTHTHTHTHTRSGIRAKRERTDIHLVSERETHERTHTHRYTHRCTHTYTHAHTLAHTRTYSHIHTFT